MRVLEAGDGALGGKPLEFNPCTSDGSPAHIQFASSQRASCDTLGRRETWLPFPACGEARVLEEVCHQPGGKMRHEST